MLLVALASGATTHAIGLEAVFGAFIAGIVLGRSRFHDADVFDPIDGITRSFFAPLFFATAGLRVDLGLLRDPEVLGWGVAVVAVASVSKAGGAYLGSRLAGLPGSRGARARRGPQRARRGRDRGGDGRASRSAC